MDDFEILVLLEAISVLDDMPSHQLVQVIKYFITHCDRKHLRDKLAEIQDGSLVEKHDPLSLVLNLIVSLPVNRQFMQKCLKELDVKELKVMLVYLTETLNHYAYNTIVSTNNKNKNKNRKKKGKKFRMPSLKQGLIWASMLIDAHYSRFIIVDEMAELVEELNDLVQAHLELCAEMAKLRGPLQHLLAEGVQTEAKLPVPTKKDYEIVQISWDEL